MMSLNCELLSQKVHVANQFDGRGSLFLLRSQDGFEFFGFEF